MMKKLNIVLLFFIFVSSIILSSYYISDILIGKQKISIVVLDFKKITDDFSDLLSKRTLSYEDRTKELNNFALRTKQVVKYYEEKTGVVILKKKAVMFSGNKDVTKELEPYILGIKNNEK